MVKRMPFADRVALGARGRALRERRIALREHLFWRSTEQKTGCLILVHPFVHDYGPTETAGAQALETTSYGRI